VEFPILGYDPAPFVVKVHSDLFPKSKEIGHTQSKSLFCAIVFVVFPKPMLQSKILLYLC